MKPKRKADDVTENWEQLYEPIAEFIIDPETTKLQFACCDCGSTHTHDMDILEDGKVRIKIKKEHSITRKLRRKVAYLFT